MMTDNNLLWYRHTIFGEKISTIIGHEKNMVEWWFNTNKKGRCIIGLGMELVDAGDAIATIQFCKGHRCFIYHLLASPDHPRFLEPLLADPEITYVGFDLRSKLDMLGLSAVRYADVHNLADLAEEERGPAYSVLTVLVRRVLENVHVVMPKPAGSWATIPLSLELSLYASFHAYMSCQMALLVKFGNIPERFSIRLAILDWSTEDVHNVRFSDRDITTTVTNRITAVENWIANVTFEGRHRHVGFDVEMCRVNGQPYVATVQLCVDRRCLIIQFFRMHGRDHYFPNLQRFLHRDNIYFMGVRIVRKMKLFTDWLLFPRRGEAKMIDTAKLVARAFRRAELVNEDIEPVTLLRLLKPGLVEEQRPHIQNGWDAPVLMNPQVEYACINAAASYDTGELLL